MAPLSFFKNNALKQITYQLCSQFQKQILSWRHYCCY